MRSRQRLTAKSSQNFEINNPQASWIIRTEKREYKTAAILLLSGRALTVLDLRKTLVHIGVKSAEKWNISAILCRSEMFRRDPNGWMLSAIGDEILKKSDFPYEVSGGPQATQLRSHLNNIRDSTTRAFVEEAIICYEHNLFRSAIVMSWVAAVDVLHKHVYDRYLDQLNKDLSRLNPKFKYIETLEAMRSIKDSVFLEAILRIGVVDKSTKDHLEICLRSRNGCGHPNSLTLGKHSAASHLEVLIQNVFERFAIVLDRVEADQPN